MKATRFAPVRVAASPAGTTIRTIPMTSSQTSSSRNRKSRSAPSGPGSPCATRRYTNHAAASPASEARASSAGNSSVWISASRYTSPVASGHQGLWPNLAPPTATASPMPAPNEVRTVQSIGSQASGAMRSTTAALAAAASTAARARSRNVARGSASTVTRNQAATRSAHPRPPNHSPCRAPPRNASAPRTSPDPTCRGRTGGAPISRMASGTTISGAAPTTESPLQASARSATVPQPGARPAVTFLALVPPDEREQGEVSGALDRRPDLPLMPRAHPRHPPRQDLAPLGDEAAERLVVLVVDHPDAGLAQRAGLALTSHHHSSSSSSSRARGSRVATDIGAVGSPSFSTTR